MRRVVVGVLVLGLACVAPAVSKGRAAHEPSPQRLYRALLSTALRRSALPAGYHSARIRIAEPGAKARQHHVVGKVEIDIDGGVAAILYAVFATPEDAAANWKSEKLSKTKTTFRVPGIAPPALLLTGSRPGESTASRGTLVGYTAITFVSGDVILEALTTSRTNTTKGDTRSTLALTELAYRHLSVVVHRLAG